MEDKRIKLIILLIIFAFSLTTAQSVDCVNCPDCHKKLIAKQDDDAKKIDKLNEDYKRMEADYKRRLANAADKSELEKIKGERDRFGGENQSLMTQLSDSRGTIKNLNDEIVKLKEQLQLKTAEATSYKNEAEKEKNEVEKLKAKNEKLNSSISGTATGATCVNEWLNDRISKTQGKILLQNRVYNLYERNEAAAELCAISFQDNSPTIKQIKVGDEIIDDPVKIECMLKRIGNLFVHYQDLYFLRFSIRNRIAGKAQFAFIQKNFYEKIFDQDKQNAIKEKETGMELKKLTIVKWSKGNENSNTISISIALDKENNDEELIKK